MPLQLSTTVIQFLPSVRLIIGLVFLLSFIGKALHPQGFVRGVVDYNVLPKSLATLYAYLLIPGEALVALCFLFNIAIELAAPVAVMMLLSFFLATAINVVRKRDIRCYCFGADSQERISGRSLARIALLAIGVGVVWIGMSSGLLPGNMAVNENSWLVEMLLSWSGAFLLLVILLWALAAPDIVRLLNQQAAPVRPANDTNLRQGVQDAR